MNVKAPFEATVTVPVRICPVRGVIDPKPVMLMGASSPAAWKLTTPAEFLVSE
jgi:hypothetical protein